MCKVMCGELIADGSVEELSEDSSNGCPFIVDRGSCCTLLIDGCGLRV